LQPVQQLNVFIADQFKTVIVSSIPMAVVAAVHHYRVARLA